MDSIALISNVSHECFAEIIGASSRKTREILFSRFGVKAKKAPPGVVKSSKLDDRSNKLHDRLKESSGKPIADVCQELVRAYLYTKRPMLKAALDHLNIPNDNGLVETEIDFFKELSEKQIEDLVKHLSKEYPKEIVLLYLGFVDAPHLEKFHA